MFPVAFVGKASVRMTNKIEGKDRSEMKLRSFVTWFCSFPLPQMVTCGLQLCASAAAHVYFSCQIVSAAAVACGAQVVGFGIQAYVKVSASVFVYQFLCAIVESYDQGAAALQSVMVQIVAAARLVSAAAPAASSGIITLVFLFMVLVCVLVQRFIFAIVESYDRVAAAFVSVKTQIVAAASLVSAVARSASFGILTLVINGATCSMGTAPRVDVEKTPQAAAAPKYLLASSGHVWTEFRGLPGPGEKFQMVEEEGKHGGGNWEKLDSFFVFVVSLGGSSVQVRVEGSDSQR